MTQNATGWSEQGSRSISLFGRLCLWNKSDLTPSWLWETILPSVKRLITQWLFCNAFICNRYSSGPVISRKHGQGCILTMCALYGTSITPLPMQVHGEWTELWLWLQPIDTIEQCRRESNLNQEKRWLILLPSGNKTGSKEWTVTLNHSVILVVVLVLHSYILPLSWAQL